MNFIRNDCITCKVRSCSILNQCDLETLVTISAHKISKSIRKGERLFGEGDPVQGVCFIKKGFLKIELNGKQGRPLVLQFAGKGTILGHRTSALHQTHNYSATAVTEVQYCYIPFNLFREITKRSQSLQEQIINQILVELDLVQKRATYLAHKTVKEKVVHALLLLAEAYGYEEKKQSFSIGFCRQDIADLAGTTKEQVSKIFKELQKDKLIRCTAKKFSYIHIEMLQKISGIDTQ